jgi:hypothetical protein
VKIRPEYIDRVKIYCAMHDTHLLVKSMNKVVIFLPTWQWPKGSCKFLLLFGIHPSIIVNLFTNLLLWNCRVTLNQSWTESFLGCLLSTLCTMIPSIHPTMSLHFYSCYILMSNMTCITGFAETLCVLLIFDENMEIKPNWTKKSFECLLVWNN